MAEQRTNASGEIVEYDEKTGRWSKVVRGAENANVGSLATGSDAEGVDTRDAGTGDPAPGENETIVSEGATTPRRAWK